MAVKKTVTKAAKPAVETKEVKAEETKARTNQHRDEALARQAELAEDTVHHECDTGHVSLEVTSNSS